VVALGGGHGLYASLSALRTLDIDITAVVTVADDGGSSGRIRRELGVLPPGDLRMALAALASSTLGPAADGPSWRDVLQHRLGGTGALAGHPIGNLLLTGLMELHADPVTALADVGRLVGAAGRVLPMAAAPLDLIAEVASVDPDDPVRHRQIRGQSAIAATAGRVTSIRMVPANPAAVAAIEEAEAVLLGPGSWFTSVIPHLLVPGLAEALNRTSGRRIVILNLEQQAGETEGFSPEQHLGALRDACPELAMDVVVADRDAVLDEAALRRYAAELGARLLLAPIAAPDATARHDPGKLSQVIAEAIGVPAADQGGGSRRHEDHQDTGLRPGMEQGVR